ncbi:MAG: hypothetical protein Q4A16_02580 [Lautropia sp.]|nr:hypothetical protein [Lautropia sp.]
MHHLRWAMPLLSVYALAPVLAMASELDSRRMTPEQTLPTLPSLFDGSGTAISAHDEIRRITVEVNQNNLPADGQTPAKLRIRAFGADNQAVRGKSLVTIETSGGRLQLPGAGSDEKGLMPADLNPVEPGMQIELTNGRAEVWLLAPPSPQTVEIRVHSGPVQLVGFIDFVPELRDMIAAGFIEGIISLRRDRGSLTLEEPRPDDGFEDQIRNWSRDSGNGKYNTALQSAFFLKGKVRGDMLLTMAYDSEHPDNNRLFRDLDPERWYPVYGDSSLVGFDAQSNSRLYVRLDKNKNYLLYGDIVTGSGFSENAGQGRVARLQTRDLGQYDRSLTGVRGHVEGRRGFFDSFAAHDSLRQVVEEFPGRGISGPYSVSNAANAVLGTEQVSILVRDRHAPSRILETRPLTRFTDYTFEPFSGRILLNRPVPSVDENLNPVSVRITYEVDQGGEKYWVYGVNGQYQPVPSVNVGGSWVKDRNPLAEFEMASANAGVVIGEKGWIRGEMARTESAADSVGGHYYTLNPNSATGTIKGEAWRAEAGYEGDRSAVGAWYGESDEGFNNPASSFSGGQRQGGVEGRRVLREIQTTGGDTSGSGTPAGETETTRMGVAVYTRGHYVENRQSGADRTQIQAGLQVDPTPRVRIEIGANRVSEHAGTSTGDGLVTASNLSAPYGVGVVSQGFGGGFYGTSPSALDPIRGETLYNTGSGWSSGYGSQVGSGLAGVPVEYTAGLIGLSWLPVDQLRLAAEIEQDIDHSEHRRAALGASWQVQEKTRLFSRYEWNTGLSTVATSTTVTDPQTGTQIRSPYRSDAFVFGLDTEYMRDGTLYSEYRMYDAISARQAQWANGLRNIWRLSPTLSLQTGAERLQVLDGTDRSSTALTMGLQWRPTERWLIGKRLEWRHTSGQKVVATNTTAQADPYLGGYDSWLSTITLSRKLNRDWTTLVRNHYLLNEFGGAQPKRYENRFQLGLAYRDTDYNRVNTLFRYEYWKRRDPVLTTGTGLETLADGYTKHIASLVADWHPTRNWWLTGRLAGKRQLDQFAEGDSRFNAYLAGGRLTHSLSERWDVSGLFLRMWSPGGTSQNAAGAELGYLVSANLWLSGGYNWSGFRDRDLSGSEYTSRGTYLRLRFKFDERLFRGSDPDVNRTLDR